METTDLVAEIERRRRERRKQEEEIGRLVRYAVLAALTFALTLIILIFALGF